MLLSCGFIVLGILLKRLKDKKRSKARALQKVSPRASNRSFGNLSSWDSKKLLEPLRVCWPFISSRVYLRHRVRIKGYWYSRSIRFETREEAMAIKSLSFPSTNRFKVVIIRFVLPYYTAWWSTWNIGSFKWFERLRFLAYRGLGSPHTCLRMVRKRARCNKGRNNKNKCWSKWQHRYRMIRKITCKRRC